MSNTFSGKYHLYTGEKIGAFQLILRLVTPVFTDISSWIVFFTTYGTIIYLLFNKWHLPILIPEDNGALAIALIIFNISLPLLLVFRTNTAYQKFWEARTLWGELVNVTRNLTRDVCIIIHAESSIDRQKKENILLLIASLAIAIKLHLRAEPVNGELASLMSKARYFRLKYHTNHPPLQIAFWIGNYFQSQYQHNGLDVYQLTKLHRSVDKMVDILGGCERILKTPQPIIYTLVLRKLIIVHCLLIPLEIVNDCHGFTGLIMTFVSLVLFGLEQIGSQLEQPFAHNPSTLPLDLICKTILFNVQELIEFTNLSSSPLKNSAKYKYQKKPFTIDYN